MVDRTRVVPDTGFILQAALNPSGPASAALRVLETERYELYLSPQVREEIEQVLNRPAIRGNYPRLGDGRAEAILQRLDEIAHLVTVIRPYIDFPRDPDDEPVLNLAIQEQARYIIARDKDLFDLGNSRDFRLLYPFLRILDPVAFLNTVAGRQASDPTGHPDDTGGDGTPT